MIPTNTWQAYNFYDADGDGFGDTWYAGGDPARELEPAVPRRGVPPRFHRYDPASCAGWLRTGKTPDFLTDDDLETFVRATTSAGSTTSSSSPVTPNT